MRCAKRASRWCRATVRRARAPILPDRWLLPEALRDETGVIFASAFPGGDRFADEFTRYYTWANLQQQFAMLEELRQYADDPSAQREIARKVGELKDELARNPYEFDRRFIFPHSGDGPQPVRRVCRRARPEHARQRRLRQHGPGCGAG
jgi:hypothetical protein